MEKLPKGLTLKWIAKNISSLAPMIVEVFSLRERAHPSLELHHIVRQPEFFDPSGFILGGIQKAHIVDAQLLGGRAVETMIDVILTTATAHTSHSYFSSDNFLTSEISALLDELGNIVVNTSVTNPRYHHADCIRKDILFANGLTPEESTGVLKMFALRKVLQQSRADILKKWEGAHSKRIAA